MTQPILSLALLLLFAAPLAAQTHFYLDEPFKRPAKILDDLLPLLREEVRSTCSSDEAFQATDLRSLFRASRITLNHRRAYLLKSGDKCLNGANHRWFSVYVTIARRYRRVLTGGGISVDILRARTQGLRDIETNMATSTYASRTLYRFNGSVYDARVCSEWEMVERNPKPHRVPCRQ
jgi:hypothetical protein